LPSGTDFLASCALALSTRIGVSGDAASELALLASGLHLPVSDLRAAARTLTELGLLNPKGRYRSVTPQPLAVYLAAKAWEDFENLGIGMVYAAGSILMSESSASVW
jgi:DNA-binding IclR family transcriptional regulator